MTQILFEKKGTVNHLVCYLPGGKPNPNGRGQGVIAGPQEWILERDTELCRRIWDKTGFGVYSRNYDINSSWNADEQRTVPRKWITGIYKYAKDNNYGFLHLVGFSGGGAVASSQLVDYPNDMVQSLAIISGPIAEEKPPDNPQDKPQDKPHMAAAKYADRIKPRTLLIYGTNDEFRRGIKVWTQKKRAELLDYVGGHDFGRKGQESFELVAGRIIEWLKVSENQGVRLRKRPRHRRVRSRAKQKR